MGSNFIAMGKKINLPILLTILWYLDSSASEMTSCKSHKDLFSLPYDYNSLLEPVPDVNVGNDLKVLNIVQVIEYKLYFEIRIILKKILYLVM